MCIRDSSIGAHLALIASDKLLRYMLIPVLPVVAFYVLRKKNMDEKGGEIARKKQILLCAVCSLAVGCYDGFYGPGTGTFLLLLFTGLGKMSVAKASGTMKVTNLSSNVAALVVFLLSGKIVDVYKRQQMNRSWRQLPNHRRSFTLPRVRVAL